MRLRGTRTVRRLRIASRASEPRPRGPGAHAYTLVLLRGATDRPGVAPIAQKIAEGRKSSSARRRADGYPIAPDGAADRRAPHLGSPPAARGADDDPADRRGVRYAAATRAARPLPQIANDTFDYEFT